MECRYPCRLLFSYPSQQLKKFSRMTTSFLTYFTMHFYFHIEIFTKQICPIAERDCLYFKYIYSHSYTDIPHQYTFCLDVLFYYMARLLKINFLYFLMFLIVVCTSLNICNSLRD